MTPRRVPTEPEEILRRLGSQVVPVEEAMRSEQRREQVVLALSRAIREASERKRRTVRRRVFWSLGVAASLALGLGVVSRQHRASVESRAMLTTVADVRGAVVVTEAGESRVLGLGAERALRAVGEIETAPEAQAELRSQKSRVRIGAATKLTVPPTTALEERYRLTVGQVDVSVDKDSRVTRSVVVETPNAEVVVHGTVFAVGVSSRSNRPVTEVSVSRGSVWVLANGIQVAVLGPGQRWSSEPAVPAAAQPSVPSALPEPVPAERAVPDATRERVPRLGPSMRAERSGLPSSSAQASALAEQGRMFQDAIDARNGGDDARAVELFGRLLSRYPNYEEAEVQLFRAQKRLGRSAAAAAEARRYLAQHPKGFAHEEARTLALSAGTPASP